MPLHLAKCHQRPAVAGSGSHTAPCRVAAGIVLSGLGDGAVVVLEVSACNGLVLSSLCQEQQGGPALRWQPQSCIFHFLPSAVTQLE